MPKKILTEKPVTIAEAKTILEGLGRELNQFQKRTLSYATSFAKVDHDEAVQLAEELMRLLDISEREAISIVNCMPESIEELRTFIPRHKVVDATKLQEVSKLIAQHAK